MIRYVLAALAVLAPVTPQSSPGTAQPIRVLVDEAHNNFHTSKSGYAALSRLLRQHGFAIVPLTTRITSDSLANADVFVSASPLPETREALIQKAREAGEEFQWSTAASKPAFSAEEIATIQTWVRGGGALLLVVDHAPNGGSGGALAAAFGVDARNSYTADDAFQGPTSLRSNPGHFVFTRKDGSLGDHAVLAGVDNVITYTGTSLAAPAGATILLRLPSTASDRVFSAESKQLVRVPAAGRGQAVALEYGRGRVIVLAEAGMLTTNPGSNVDICGTRAIAQEDIGNRRFALNVVRWLGRRTIDPAAAVTFINSGCLAPPALTITIEGVTGTSSVFAGTWTAALPGLQAANTIDLKVDGGRVFGEISNATARTPLLSGSVDGKRIMFTVKSPNGEREITFAGTLAGDEISFTREVKVPPGGPPGGTGIFGAGGPKTFVATRGGR